MKAINGKKVLDYEVLLGYEEYLSKKGFLGN